MTKDKSSSQWTLWLAGILSTIMLTGIVSLANAVSGNDKDSRERDKEISQDVAKAVISQQETNKEMAVLLTEIKTDLKYLRKEKENN